MSTIAMKAYKGMGMEGRVAKWYAANTYKSLEEFKKLARQVAAELAPQSRVLEVAPGPGYFAIELAKLGYMHVEGLDISKTFVEIAQKNAREANVQVTFRQGDAANMPLESEAYDFVLCRAAFKNFSQPVKALEEMYRVLKPGGKGLLIDLRSDATPQAIRQAVDAMGLTRVNRIITRLTFRFMLLKRAYSEKQLREFFAQTKFGTVDIRGNLIGFEVRFAR